MRYAVQQRLVEMCDDRLDPPFPEWARAAQALWDTLSSRRSRAPLIGPKSRREEGMAGGLRKISLTLREPGVVQVEIVTSPTLGTLPGEREDGTKGDFTPDEYLPEPYCCRFQTLGDEGGWRYPSVEISVLT
jgi:hypothetical protein